MSLTTAVAASSGPCLFSVSQGCVEVDDAIEDLSDVVGQKVIGGASCGNQSVSPIIHDLCLMQGEGCSWGGLPKSVSRLSIH